jgi:tetratricopeptide (TPR) repeat protein
MHAYRSKDLQRQFRLPAPLLQSLVRAGRIHPVKVGGDRARYSFQDLLVLRMASALYAAKIPQRKIDAALANMKSLLPGATLNALSVSRLEEGAAAEDRRVSVYQTRRNTKHPVHLAQRHFERAVALEKRDPDGALAAYEESLAQDAHHVEARINLGRLLHLKGEHKAAEEIYRAGLTANAVLSFNLALLLEDLDREREAILAYREALSHDPGFADAHFNLARLHDLAGRAGDAFRHLLTYRRLMRDIRGKRRGRARSNI